MVTRGGGYKERNKINAFQFFHIKENTDDFKIHQIKQNESNKDQIKYDVKTRVPGAFQHRIYILKHITEPMK